MLTRSIDLAMPSSPLDDAEVQQIICQMKTQHLGDNDAKIEQDISTPASMLAYLKEKDDRFVNVSAMRFKRAFNKANSSLKCDDDSKMEGASSKSSKRKAENLAASHGHTAKMCSREYFEQNRALFLQLEKTEAGAFNAEHMGLLARLQALALQISLAGADDKATEDLKVCAPVNILSRHACFAF